MAQSAAEKRVESRARSQLTPEDWIRAAADVLINKSIDAVRVEVLAKELNVSRGSFYWHFRDRQDLLQRVLLAWRDEATEQVIGRIVRRRASPEELINELSRLPFRGGAARRAATTELAVRAWARRDEMARHVLDAVDSQRLDHLRGCFEAAGFDAANARRRAFSLYAFQLAEALLVNQGSPAEQEARRKRLVESLLRAED